MFPMLLEKGTARWLSDEIYKKTGCFPFLYPNEEIVIGRPQNDNDSFYYIVNGLYILYHDFGKHFLDFFIEDSDNMKNHRDDVSFLRTLIAHGNHNSKAYDETIRIQFKRRFSTGNPELNWENGFFGLDSMKQDDWKTVCKKLVDDSNNLYDHITKWLESHSEDDAEETANEFHNDNFFKSFNGALVREAIKYLKDIGRINNLGDIDETIKNVNDKKNEWIKELYFKQSSQKAMYNKFVDIVRDVIDPDPTPILLNMIPKL